MAKVNVCFILDKSGSMEAVRDATIDGFNEYLLTLRKDKKSEYNFSLTLFDTEFIKKYINKPLKNVKDLDRESYDPSECTALYDAACSTIKAFQKEVKGKRSKNLVIVMTDGMENSSKEYTEKEFKKIIQELQKKETWTFVFLGANQDSWANAQKWGMHKGNVVNYKGSKRGTKQALKAVGAASMNFACSAANATRNFFGGKTDIKED